MIARWNLKSGSTTARHGASSGTPESSATDWFAAAGISPLATTSRTASTSSAIRSRNTSMRCAGSKVGTWTPRLGSRSRRPSEIRIWVAALKEWRAMPSRLANSFSRSRAPGFDLAVEDQLAKGVRGRLDGRYGRELKALGGLLAWGSSAGLGEGSSLTICHIIPQSDKMRQAEVQNRGIEER